MKPWFGTTADFKDRSIEHGWRELRGTVTLQQGIRHGFLNSLLQASIKSDIKLYSKTESEKIFLLDLFITNSKGTLCIFHIFELNYMFCTAHLPLK